ncbi:MAG TPA: DUF6801 domain-containing protein [Nocardioides sp.]|nr:DUF6801 domain-containing protein [Nocardioides sp.]
MKLRSITTRAALAGATTALVAGGLVVATNTAADAADASGDYTCAVPILGDQTFPMTVSVPLLPPSAPAGFPVDAGLLSYSSTITVPSGAAGALGSFGVVGGTIDDYTMKVGSLDVAAPGTYTATPPAEDGSVVMDGTGANEAFNLPAAGTYDVKLPASFTFTPMTADGPLEIGGQPVAIGCTTAAPATLGSVQLTKQISTMTAKAAKAGKAYKVTATVKNEYTKPTGKVTTKLGKKTYSAPIKNGKAVIKLPKTAKGKKLTLKYGGDAYSAPTTAKVTVPKK